MSDVDDSDMDISDIDTDVSKIKSYIIYVCSINYHKNLFLIYVSTSSNPSLVRGKYKNVKKISYVTGISTEASIKTIQWQLEHKLTIQGCPVAEDKLCCGNLEEITGIVEKFVVWFQRKYSKDCREYLKISRNLSEDDDDDGECEYVFEPLKNDW